MKLPLSRLSPSNHTTNLNPQKRQKDQTRLKIKNASSMNKSTLLTQDKILRNKVNNLVNKDNMAYNK